MVETNYAMAGPKSPYKDDPFRKRFSDWFKPAEVGDNVGDYAELGSQIWKFKYGDQRNRRYFYSGLTDINPELAPTPPFWDNQRSMETFYHELAQSPIYKGMFEAIGRTTIYASQYVDNPFAKFVKDPVTQGNAVMSAVFSPIHSRPWRIRNGEGKYNDEWGEDDPSQLSKVPLFNAQIPQMKSSVARMEFVREIPLKMNAQEYAKYCQTPEMIGQVATSLMTQSNATYRNDMFAAAKSYFCGPLRIRYDPYTTVGVQVPDADADYPTNNATIPGQDQGKNLSSDELNLPANQKSFSPMVDIIEGDGGPGDPFDCDPIKMIKLIHDTVEVDWQYMSTEYNPEGHETKTDSATVIMDKHLLFNTFKKTYAETYHPEQYKLAPDFVYIDKFPEFSARIYNKDYHLAAIIVDDNVPAMYPQGAGLSVQTWYDPQEESMNFFTHYKWIFEFKPFFNRKYIYIHNAVN